MKRGGCVGKKGLAGRSSWAVREGRAAGIDSIPHRTVRTLFPLRPSTLHALQVTGSKLTAASSLLRFSRSTLSHSPVLSLATSYTHYVFQALLSLFQVHTGTCKSIPRWQYTYISLVCFIYTSLKQNFLHWMQPFRFYLGIFFF